MNTLEFLLDWPVRSSILILGGTLLLSLLRVRDASIRAAAWTGMLAGSLAIPLLHEVLPSTTVPVSMSLQPPAHSGPAMAVSMNPAGLHQQRGIRAPEPPQSAGTATPGVRPSVGFPFSAVALAAYALVCGAMFLRIGISLAIGFRLRRMSLPAGHTQDGIELRESDQIRAPMTLGIVRPVVMLPADWRNWPASELEAVLAHERSHVVRRDLAIQLVSAVHRALLWISPLSWFLHARIVQTAEEVSDDAALAATDRAGYAKILLHFMQRRLIPRTGVSMARYGSAEQRIHRILDGVRISRGLTRWSLAAMLALGSPLAYVAATAQTRPQFSAADVRLSPRLMGERQRALFGRLAPGAILPDGRFEAQHATLVDLIATAYGVAADQVSGGPSWIEWNHYDVAAQAPANTRAGAVPFMLQSLLADRFGLVVHEETKLVPGYVLSLGPGKHKLGPASDPERPGCQAAWDNDGLVCRGTGMGEFAARLAAAPATKLRVVNSTGIEGSWDFDLRYPRAGTPRGLFGIPPPGDNDRGIFDAIEKQLGLKLELASVPQSVLVVDRANETPVADSQELESPPLEFEAATIKPCKGIDPAETAATSGLLVSTICMPLSGHINLAWGFMNGPGSPEDAFEGPGWMDSLFFDIQAKSPIAIGGPRDANYLAMLRNLLVDRFRIKTHYENKLKDLRVLVADKPRLKPTADPSSRARCFRPSGFSSLTCQNVTMAQFAELIGTAGGGGRFYDSVDETGLTGGWDVSIEWQRPAADSLLPISLEEAIEQLGLKLEVRKRPAPILIIDHIEQNPADN